MIELRGVSKRFGAGDREVQVLHGVDLVVERGEIAAVIGQSGAGKTTLARLVSLLDRPTAGEVVIAGRPLAGLPERRLREERRAIGTIFQGSSQLAQRTAAENVALPLEFAGVSRRARRARVAELLERVGLADHADRHPSQLSGGQRQRVGIARALALEPRVLVADEATSGLDPRTTRSILSLLVGLRDELGLTILLITHEMDVVRQVADRVTLLEDGRVVESGHVVDVVREPHSQLGMGLLPERAAIEEAAAVRLHVVYGDDTVPVNWVERLARETGVAVGILSATVETVAGRRAGRMTISLSEDDPRVPTLLRGWGLHVERLDGPVDAEPPEVRVA